MWNFVTMYVCHQKSLIRCFRKFSRSLLQRIQGSALIRHQHQLSDWLRRYNKSTTNRIQTPLLRFVVDLLYNLLYNKSTTNRISGVWALPYVGLSRTTPEINKMANFSHQCGFNASAKGFLLEFYKVDCVRKKPGWSPRQMCITLRCVSLSAPTT